MNGMKFWTFEGDSKLDMTEFLRNYLTTSGTLYHKNRFDTTSYRYSNVGYALLALIVEHTSGQSFEEFCREKIFSPLMMNHTSWFLSNLNVLEVAKTYPDNKKFKGSMGFPFYPSGQLRTSISDYTNFIKGYLSNDSTFILSSKTRHLITPKPDDHKNKYYTWELDSTFDGHTYYRHDGGLPGVRAYVLMDVTDRNGVVVFANSETDMSEVIAFIDKKIFR
jgi:CubicO group peptidase (beta-lactamase class C family)